MTPYLGAVFDMDGTLIASEAIYREAWRRAADDLAYTLTSGDYVRLMGLNRGDTLRELTVIFRSEGNALAFLARSEVHYDDIVRTDGHRVRAGIVALLDALRLRGIPLAVATSTHRSLAEETLRSVGLRDYFRTVLTGDEVARGKPHPEIYERAVAALALTPARCLAFEDSLAGATSAHAAGLSVVLIPELSPVECPRLERVYRFAAHGEALPLFG